MLLADGQMSDFQGRGADARSLTALARPRINRFQTTLRVVNA